MKVLSSSSSSSLGVLTPGGATYDAYTLERWRDPVRSDEMLQQTPSEAGKPWAKILSVGTNMKQMVSGPDGNPKGLFTGMVNTNKHSIILSHL